MPSDRPSKRARLAEPEPEPEVESNSELESAPSDDEDILVDDGPIDPESECVFVSLLLRRWDAERRKDVAALTELQNDASEILGDLDEDGKAQYKPVFQALGSLDSDTMLDLESYGHAIRLAFWASQIPFGSESSSQVGPCGPSLLEEVDASAVLKALEQITGNEDSEWNLRSMEELDAAMGYAVVWNDRLYRERLRRRGGLEKDQENLSAEEFQLILAEDGPDEFPQSELRKDRSDVVVRGKPVTALSDADLEKLFLASEKRRNMMQIMIHGQITDLPTEFDLGEVEDDDDDEELGGDNDDNEDDEVEDDTNDGANGDDE